MQSVIPAIISAQSNKLNGTWVQVKPDIDGNALLPPAKE